MSGKRRTRSVRRTVVAKVSDASLLLVIVLAPALGGSSRPVVLPGLAALAALGFVTALVAARRARQRMHVYLFPVALLALAGFTAFQATPLPEGLLSVLSHRAHSLRSFIVGDGGGPISYEPGATLREAAKLGIYALVAVTAWERSRARRGLHPIAQALVISGGVSIALAFIHQAAGSTELFGVLPWQLTAREQLTTFVNPNHGAGFLVITAMAALGLAMDARDGQRRSLYLALCVLYAAVSGLCFSRGGLGALALALFGFFALRLAARRTSGERIAAPPWIVLALIIPTGVLLAQYDKLVQAFATEAGDPFGMAAKLAAMQDAWPLILDHPWLGIGRGAYTSVYPAYKTSAFQLTFTHPENVAMQLGADWGLIVGGGALVGLLVVIGRRIRHAEGPLAQALVVGVAAATAQNVFDFSLELAGVAIPMVAVLGACSRGLHAFVRVPLDRTRAFISAFVFPTLGVAALVAGAFALPDLQQDMAKLDAHVSARAAAKGADIDRVSEAAPLALRHPAHPMGPARLAYLAETADPPRLREAVQWANKTLYLAPTYADVYVAVGRLLMGAGHRDQGLDSMRQGWALVDPFRRDALIRRIVARCETWQEVRRAVPRQDLVQDILDGEQAAHAALALDRMQGKAGARALLETLNPEQVAPDDLNMVAWAALAVRADAIAEGAVKRRRRLVPADPRAARTQLQLLNTLGRTEEAHALLRELVDAGGLDPVPLLRVQAPITIQERRFELAREVIDTLERTAAPTISTQVEVARLRASLSARAGRTQEALGVLQTGIRLAPGDPSLRLQRAKLLLRLGRRAEASLDLDHVLKLRPDHPEAQALRDALEAARPTTPPRPELIPTPSSGTPAPTRP